MNNSTTNKRPRFFWQGLMIILPVLVLAVVGLFSLRQDEQAAEQTVRKKAAENVASLARAVSVMTYDQLREYLVLEGTWISTLQVGFLGTATEMKLYADSTNLPNQDILAMFVRWEKSYPSLDLKALFSENVSFTDLPDQTFPADFSPVPGPPSWFLDLSPGQRKAWQTLRQSQSADMASDGLANTWAEFLGTDPSKESRLAASNYARLNQAQEQGEVYSGFTESGLPFAAVACLQTLDRVTPASWSLHLLDQLAMNVSRPSFLTTMLLERANERLPTDPFMQEKLRCIEKKWDIDSVARQRFLAVRQHSQPPPAKFWVNTPGVEALAFEFAAPPDTVVQFIPLPVMEAVFARALAENQFLVPDYASPVISVESEPLPMSGFVRPAEDKSLLARATEKGGWLPVEPAFNVAFYLTSREKMLSAEEHRAHLFGALIGAAVLAALAGLLAARRGFYQQQRLAEMKSNFVSSVSHELRAPIASMRLLAEALERGKISEPAKQQGYYRFLVQESRRLTSLIENVLDFSRIEQGRKEYRFEPTDLDSLASQTVKLMLPYAAERQVPLLWQPGHGLAPQLTCDGPALQQALINLIDNAIKHSPANAAVSIGLESDADTVRLWVEDCGPGIPPEEHEKIFERFYRRGSELRRETQGIGIGLTIVKHIVEAHRGRVLVRSAIGQGSRFTIELPLKQA